MADKNISALNPIESLNDDSLLVVEQGGKAGKMTGAQFRKFAEDSVTAYVEAAANVAEAAKDARNEAKASASAAAAAATAAASSEKKASDNEKNAQAAKTAAQQAQNAAQQAQEAAQQAQTAAGQSAAAAASSEQKAKNSETVAMGSAASAQDAAVRAQVYAETLNMDDFNAQIAAKGDNLEFDNEEGLLYLTSNGIRVGDGIKVATSGGAGGGGESNNAVLSLSNTSGWIYKNVSLGAPVEISYLWSSLESGMATGVGIRKITVNNALKHTAQVEQGSHTEDIGPYLNAGSNAVKLSITDVYGNARSISFNLTAVSLKLESTFDPQVAYTGDIVFPYTPTGNAIKTMYFKMDGTLLSTAVLSVSGRQQTFVIPAQSHGSHLFEVYFTSVVDGETVESNHLYYDLICLEAGNTTPVITTSFRGAKAEQYDSLTILYIVYNPTSLTSEIVLASNEIAGVTPLTVDRTEQVWTYRPETAGKLRLSITCGNAVKLIELDITESSVEVNAETENLSLYLTSYGRSNNEADPSVWNSGSVAAQLTGFNFVSDGWMLDEDNITALRVSGDARVEIPAKLFETDFRTSGKTIEIEFATRDVLNYDAELITCWSGERGLKITAQKALLKSEQSEISTQYKEDERVRLSFVVEKKAAHRLLMIYINGILSGAMQYAEDDDFSQTQAVGISIGSNECTTDIYCIRAYDNDLTRYQILDNWIADTQVSNVKVDRYRHNAVFDDYGAIVIDQLPKDLPYLILTGPALPAYKGNVLPIAGEYVDPTNEENSFTFEGAEIDVQGTSSAGYERKNYKIKFKGGFNRGGKISATYQLGVGNVPTDTFTFKADVASSEGANNVELAKLYEDISPYRTPPQLVDKRVRQGIDGYPIVIFHNDGNGVTFIGKYNFNHDKGTEEVFGFAAGDESWETKNNTSKRALWQSADYSGSDWENDFEGRYPDKNKDVSNLSALAAWLVSTDRSSKTLSESAKASRLAKFKAEFSDHLELESALFYYLFTELFLLADSRAKNSFPTRYGEHGWCWLPYDMDTAIGINNEGKLAFGYDLEDTDLVNGAQVYTGQQSVLWNNLRDAFPDELKAMYQELRSSGGLSYEDTERRFKEHQAKWPAAIFNEDAYYKYLAPLFEKNNGSYLGMLQGSKAEQRKWWLYNRFRYIDSKYNAGDALKDFITLRGYEKGDITVTPYADIYATVKYGSYLVQKRARRGGSYVLECPVDDLDDTEIYIYSASQIADVGDLSALKVGYAEFANGTKLRTLKLGDASSGYSNNNLTQLYLGNNVLLKTLDVRNCPNLGNTAADVNATASIDLSGCTNIEEVYFDNTAITGCLLPNGGILKKLHLPGTVTNLTIRNQPQLSEFRIPSYRQITTLRVENVPGVDSWTILQTIPANSRVRLIGFDWTLNSMEDVLALYDKLDTMRGLDESGNNTDKAQMMGTIRVDSITGTELAELQSRYPSITVAYNHITCNLFFYDDTGTTLLYTDSCTDGEDGEYGGVTMTKEQTAQYSYTFAGWSKTLGGAADPDALKNVTTDRNVYAVFTATPRTYTVRFYNEGTLYHIVENVPYGSSVTPPDDPVKEGDYAFAGWSPEPSVIVGDTDYHAQYKSTAMVYSKVLSRTISGTYTNATVTSIGREALCDCKELVTVDLYAATSIGENAFNGCSKFTTLILRSTTLCSVTGATGALGFKITGIYVPAALVDSYKASGAWSYYASKFFALEDYTVDGTITGAIDLTKI